MSRKKGKSKPRGHAKSTPCRTPSKRHSSQPWPVEETTTPKFSLADEARWMSNHRTAAFEAGKRLRHMPIQFISAGCLEGKIKERKSAVEDSDVDSEDESLAPSSPASSAPPDNTEALAQMAIRSPSPAPSQASSSADEVVFRGRRQLSQLSASTPSMLPTVQPAVDASASACHEVEVQASVKPNVCVKGTPGSESDGQSERGSVVQDGFARRRDSRPAWEGTTTPWESRSKADIGWLTVKDRPDMDALIQGKTTLQDAAMDDYLQNMEEFGLTNDLLDASGFARREMNLEGGSHNDWESASDSQEGTGDINDSDSWDSDMLQDFEDISTSSDNLNTVARVLSKRLRKSGLHYLCVYEGSATDDARWLPSNLLKSAAEIRLIQAFEEKALLRDMRQDSLSDSSDDVGNEDEDKEEEQDDEEEEEEEEEDFDDETIARVLQKQEELGLGSDEVLLYAGDGFFDKPDPHPSFSDFGRPNKKRQARVRGNRDPVFPSASAMADALSMDPYGGFDIMDTERPSLRPKKKGRRGQMPPELEDANLNEQLQMAWAADRAKKRLKKAEREELRQQGLLGRKGRGANLKVKYQGGIGMEDVVEEIREFIMGDMQTLSLPPMEANRRAAVHQAAAFLNLTSRSRGDGHERFTVLAKTTRTRTWTDDEFDIAIQRRGFQKRLRGSLHSQGGGRPSKSTIVRHSNRVRPQTGYQDGDTVGANAPELGPENKGHALLSKMGWSKGIGLGAPNNKGILQPIAHTVKTNKAGLQ